MADRTGERGMARRAGDPRRTRLLLVVSVFAASCTPVAFRPARTVQAGELEHTLGMTGFSSPGVYDKRIAVPGASYALRYGASSQVDLGIGAATPGALTLDATVQLVRGSTLDLALGPSFAWDFFEGIPAAGMPVFVDLNLGSAASFVAYAGPVAVLGYASSGDRSLGLLYQAGAGFDLRLRSGVSLRPHAGILDTLPGKGDWLGFAGLGIAFGGGRGF